MAGRPTLAQGEDLFFPPWWKSSLCLVDPWQGLRRYARLLLAIGRSDWHTGGSAKSRVGVYHALVNMTKKLPSLLP
jgi:hypothetical protein